MRIFSLFCLDFKISDKGQKLLRTYHIKNVARQTLLNLCRTTNVAQLVSRYKMLFNLCDMKNVAQHVTRQMLLNLCHTKNVAQLVSYDKCCSMHVTRQMLRNMSHDKIFFFFQLCLFTSFPSSKLMEKVSSTICQFVDIWAKNLEFQAKMHLRIMKLITPLKPLAS